MSTNTITASIIASAKTRSVSRKSCSVWERKVNTVVRCLMATSHSCLVRLPQFKAMKMFARHQKIVRSVLRQSKLINSPQLETQFVIFRDLKCKDASLSLKDLTGGKELEVITAGNATYPEMENRTQDCELNMVGKPVFHNYLNGQYGAWLRDPIQKDNITIEKIWLTKENEPSNLYEYKNRIDYRKDKPSRNQPYKLPCPFKVKKATSSSNISIDFLICILQGNAHIVYNSNFYYYCADGSKIIRYDLKTERAAGEFKFKVSHFISCSETPAFLNKFSQRREC